MSRTAVIIGATGGIGAALADALDEEGEFDTVLRLGRSMDGDAHIDLADPGTIKQAAERVAASGASIELVIVATGLLHDADHGPEKSLREIEADWMQRNFLINATGPALVARHFAPIMPRDKRVTFAALSARVGSISDNRIGGWYGYRASKAALNQLIKTMSIEWRRTHKRSLAIALHPGTVDTPLSEPFQGNVPEGQLFDRERAAGQLLDVLDGLKPVDSGKIFAWDGAEIKP